ncbi:MAG: hypothetical protein MJ227_01750 [Bacilli bacterium]|nr:hypothetical protein [Bacilli bacterium]
MKRNSIKKLACLSLLGLLGLTACNTTTASDVYAKPDNYSDSSVSFEKDSTVVNGYKTMEEVYDAWREGNIPSNVAEKIIIEYSYSAFGKYDDLKSIAEKIKNKEDLDTVRTFINNHKVYQTSPRVEKDEFALVSGKFAAIEKRIAQRMYKLVSGGSYTEDSIFDEAEMLKSLLNDSQSVSHPKEATTYKGLVLPSVEPEEVFETQEELGGDSLLHRENYQSLTNTYIDDKITPEIYKELLNEQYLLEEAKSTIGRSRARKINVFSITARSGMEDGKAAEYLMNYLFEVLTSAPKSAIWKNHTEWLVEGGSKLDVSKVFTDFSNAWVGNVEPIKDGDGTTKYKNTVLEDILAKQAEAEDPVFKYVEETEEGKESQSYYKSTDRGLWMTDVDKIDADPKKTDTSVESEFTGNNTYTVEHGIELKERADKLKDYTSSGWYIASDGAGTLPSSISNRLFNVTVSDSKKENETDPSKPEYAPAYDRWQKVQENSGLRKSAEYEYSKDNDYGSYLARIAGNYFLRNNDLLPGSEDQDIIFKDGSTYYVVQVEEAVNSTKMGSSDTNYSSLGRTAEDIQDITNEVAKIIAAGSTYQDLAKDYWLKKMSLEYHDTVVFNYFAETYPDLFK